GRRIQHPAVRVCGSRSHRTRRRRSDRAGYHQHVLLELLDAGLLAPEWTCTRMKAVVQDSYGSTDVLRLQDIDTPGIQDDEVLIGVRAAAVNPLDWFIVKGGKGRLFFGIRKPRIRVRGIDVAGHVEAVGKAVQQFRPGDDVFGGARGAFAEFAPARATS